MLPRNGPDRIQVAFKEGAQRHNYPPQADRGAIRPILAVSAGTGEVRMCRLRKGRANTARGAASFLRETVSRVRYARATGPLIRLRRTGRQRLLLPSAKGGSPSDGR